MSVKNIINSFEIISKYGGNMIQVFISNPHSTNKTKLLDKYSNLDSEEIKKYLKKNNYKLMVHSPYVFNISNQHLNIISLYKELVVSSKIGAYGYVLHVGKSKELNIYDAKKYMYLTLQLLIKKIIENNLKLIILLETPAGQGTELLTNLDELSLFYNKFTKKEKKYLKICVDTCHIFASGYDLREPDEISEYFKNFKTKIGLKNLGLIHLNDSKTELESNVDRHENIGKGKIGYKGLELFLLHAYKYNIPILLETPNNGYIKEIPWIRKVIKKL